MKDNTDAAPQPCDFLLVGGDVVDGTGGRRYPASVAITGNRIAGIGPEEAFHPKERIDVSDCAVCPGFIDVHTHDDQAVLATPDMTFKTSQGVTTIVTGNCGVSLAPLTLGGATPPSPLTEVGQLADFQYASFAEYISRLDNEPPAVNVAGLVGHTTLRAGAMESLDRPANESERKAMRAACEAAIDAGAIGVSSGLFYPPAIAAPAEEVTELVSIAAAKGGLYAAHIRSESDEIAEALEEAFDIAEKGGARLILSHHKVSGQRNFGRSRETLRQIAHAKTRQRIAFDVYPYAASSTMLNKSSWKDANRVLITWSDPYPEMAGRELSDAAAALGFSEEQALDALSPGGAVYFTMDEADVRRILSSPNAMIGSDGVPFSKRPHPRLYGTFTRVLGHYVREENLFSFEEAVRRMTSYPAAEFGLAGRGVVEPGAIADLTIVDPATVKDAATYDAPTEQSIGVRFVFVGGRCVYKNDASTGERPGRVLRRNDNGIAA